MSTTATGTRFSMFSDEDLRHLSNGVKANIAGCESGLLYGARAERLCHTGYHRSPEAALKCARRAAARLNREAR